ncbi:TauD/TfdA dioxygenase family protein [Salinicola endophyticus]|uniref:TauD/TfdA dioxygenase family protein n=1 Tax=Salinicola endophyticus TaxID=1949083 RepID=UPI000DA130F8|nr:TauD/TfdA family dioxygenase [Salinicola endophyticus]
MDTITQWGYEILPTGSHMGGEVRGIQVRDIDAPLAALLKNELLHYKVLILRNQCFSHDDYLTLARQFGEIAKYPFASGIEDYPEIVQIVKTPTQRQNFSGKWHVDSTYLETPPDYTFLTARETPPLGGDTVFSNAEAVFHSLSEGLQALLENQEVEFASDVHATQRGQHLTNFSGSEADTYRAVHPAVMRHPRGGKRALYINEEHALAFKGMTREESQPLIRYLTERIAQSEFTFRLTWEKDMVALWDNRLVHHHAVNDYHGALRVMDRITVNDRGLEA